MTLKKVLLFANVGTAPNGFYHVGDEAMFYETYRFYRTQYPSIKLSAIVSQPNHSHLQLSEYTDPIDPTKFSFFYFLLIVLKTVVYHRLRFNIFSHSEFRLYNIVSHHHRLHLCGGGNLNSLFPHWLYYSLTIIFFARSTRIPTLVTSQTIGPFNFFDQFISRLILNQVDLLSIRGQSRSPKKFAITRPPCQNTLDAAHLLTVHRYPVIPPRQHIYRIGLSLHNWPPYTSNLLSQVNQALLTLSTIHDIEVILIPHILTHQPTTGDLHFMTSLIELSHHQYPIFTPNIDLIYQALPTPAHAIKSLTVSSDLIITTRYHGSVFALSHHIPCLTFKLDPYYNEKNQQLYAFYTSAIPTNLIELDKSPADNLVTTIDQLLTHNSKYRQALQKNNRALLKKYHPFKKI